MNKDFNFYWKYKISAEKDGEKRMLNQPIAINIIFLLIFVSKHPEINIMEVYALNH